MKRLILFVTIIIGISGVFSNSALAYSIDGYLGDWGVTLGSESVNKGYLNTDLPSGGLDIDYITEDNAASNISGWQYVGPGYSYGSSSPSSNYYMKGNSFDVEAIYFDNDQYYAYIAIVQGLPSGGGTAPWNPWFLPGDIAIDADNKLNTGEYGFEYGLKISDSKLYLVRDWGSVYYSGYSSSNPWAIKSGSEIGLVDFVYSGNQNSHYILEAAIPLSFLGLSANPGDPVYTVGIHWTQQCGNDSLNLSADVNPVPVPEPSTFLLVGAGLTGVAIYGRRKFKN